MKRITDWNQDNDFLPSELVGLLFSHSFNELLVLISLLSISSSRLCERQTWMIPAKDTPTFK